MKEHSEGQDTITPLLLLLLLVVLLLLLLLPLCWSNQGSGSSSLQNRQMDV